jgi:hypothetical protein
MARKDGKAKRKKMKLPKEIGGIKLPKELRKEGNRLISAATALITTQAAAAMIDAASRIRFERGPRRPRSDWDAEEERGVER